MRNVSVTVDPCPQCNVRPMRSANCHECQKRRNAAERLRFRLNALVAPMRMTAKASIGDGDLTRIDFEVLSPFVLTAHLSFVTDTFPQDLISKAIDGMKDQLWKYVAGQIST